MSLIVLYFAIKQFFARKKKKEDKRLILLAKMRKLGLSNKQIKIVNYITKLNKLSSIEKVHANKELFENSIGQVIREFKIQQLPLSDVCRDVSLAYEKLYSPSRTINRLIELKNLSPNHIISFTPENEADKVFFSKVVSVTDESIIAKLLKKQDDVRYLKDNISIDASIWKNDDGEYYFTTSANFNSLENDDFEILMPENLLKRNEFDRPYMNVAIDCELTLEDNDPTKEKAEEPIKARIVKMNTDEAIVTTRVALAQGKVYWFDFTINDFRFSLEAKTAITHFDPLINVAQATLVFKNMSPMALNVLKNYLDSLM